MDNTRVFELWKTSNAPYLARFRGTKLLIAFSGEKDSVVCVHLLDRLHGEYGYEIEAHMYALPRHLYTPAYRAAIPRKRSSGPGQNCARAQQAVAG
jgi:hypothetical protein